MNAAAITIPYVVVKENEATYERLRANYSQPEIYDKIAVTDTKCKCSVISFGLH